MELEEENTSTPKGEMSGGRKSKKSRKSNNALNEWVKFVKKVRAEEKIDSYKKAMSRAKVRADKGEKWRSMKGGEIEENEENEDTKGEMDGGLILGGRRRSRRRTRSKSRSRTKSRSKSRRRSRY
jgi:hypothetical protein